MIVFYFYIAPSPIASEYLLNYKLEPVIIFFSSLFKGNGTATENLL